MKNVLRVTKNGMLPVTGCSSSPRLILNIGKSKTKQITIRSIESHVRSNGIRDTAVRYLPDSAWFRINNVASPIHGPLNSSCKQVLFTEKLQTFFIPNLLDLCSVSDCTSDQHGIHDIISGSLIIFSRNLEKKNWSIYPPVELCNARAATGNRHPCCLQMGALLYLSVSYMPA